MSGLTAARLPRKPRQRRPWRTIATATVWVWAILGAYGLMRARWTGGPGTLIAKGIASEYDQVVVADFRVAPFNLSLGATVAEWLRVDLDQSDILRPLPPEVVGEALGRLGRNPRLPLDRRTAHQIAQAGGYPLVVVGEVGVRGHRYLLMARLEAGTSGEVLGTFRETADGEAALVGPWMASTARFG